MRNRGPALAVVPDADQVDEVAVVQPELGQIVGVAKTTRRPPTMPR